MCDENTFCACLSNIGINNSLAQGYFPSAWKHGLICPISKKPRPSVCKDFRPITMLPFMSKLLEKVCCSQISNYFESIHALPPTQSGFRKGFSTATSLMHLSNSVLSAFEKSEVSIIVTLDFSKAFDTINHELLFAKCKYYGLSDMALKWLHSYLSGRSQSVDFNNDTSQSLPLKSGVPQGSILGPLLFISYTSDLAQHQFSSSMRTYADDTFLVASCSPTFLPETIESLNEDVSKIVQWSENNALIINPTKSKLIVADPTSRLPQENDLHLVVGDTRIEPSSHLTVLGLTLDTKWSFESHVASKCRTAYGILRALYPHRHTLPRKLKLQLCDSLVLSIFNHGVTTYDPCLSEAS